MSDRTKVVVTYEATMDFDMFCELCLRLCDRKYEKWRKMNLETGLSFANLDGWQRWIDERYDGVLPIRCVHSYYLVEKREGRQTRMYMVGDTYNMATKRRIFLDEFNFHVVK